jgi:hypothetical protein
MRFRILVLSAVVALSGAVSAQAVRDKLDGFYKLPFGTPFTEAKQKLGATAGESVWVSSDKSLRLKTLTHHDPSLLIGLKSHFVTYYFDAKERLMAAAFTSKYESKEEDDVAACYKASTVVSELIARYGNPNSQRERDDALYVLFAFKDGSEIETKVESDDKDCELRVVMRSAAGEKQKLFVD